MTGRLDRINTFLDLLPDGYPNALLGEIIRKGHNIGSALGPPIYALIKITERCNAFCQYCSHAGQLEDLGEAGTSDWKKLLGQVARCGVRTVNFSGGEPLLRGDILELLEHSRKLGLYTILLTNGVLLSKYVIELIEVDLGLIFLSLDGLAQGPFMKNRGINVHSVINSLEETIDRIRGKGRGPEVVLTCVLSRHNLDEVVPLIKYSKTLGVRIQFTPVHCYSREDRERLLPVDRKEYTEVVRTIMEAKKNGNPICNSLDYLKNFVGFSFNRRYLPRRFQCSCGQTCIYIDDQLRLLPCWVGGMPILADLRRVSLEDAWQSARYNLARERMKKLKCPRCWMLCTAEISIRWRT